MNIKHCCLIYFQFQIILAFKLKTISKSVTCVIVQLGLVGNNCWWDIFMRYFQFTIVNGILWDIFNLQLLMEYFYEIFSIYDCWWDIMRYFHEGIKIVILTSSIGSMWEKPFFTGELSRGWWNSPSEKYKLRERGKTLSLASFINLLVSFAHGPLQILGLD